LKYICRYTSMHSRYVAHQQQTPACFRSLKIILEIIHNVHHQLA
jgi:hypothetical protein